MIYPPWIVSTEGPNHELFTWLELLSPGTACVLMALLYTGQMLDGDVAAQMDSNWGHQFSHYSAASQCYMVNASLAGSHPPSAPTMKASKNTLHPCQL